MTRLTILTVLIAGLAFITTSATVIYVPGDYPTIQQGVDACNWYDTVMVANGTYYENVLVINRISLIGENRDSTIIDGSGTGSVVIINCPGVNVLNFTLRNTAGFLDAGIEIRYADSCLIDYCKFVDNGSGVSLCGASYNVISRNTFLSNDNGIKLREDSLVATPDNVENVIQSNVINDNEAYGILFEHTILTHHMRNLILGNRITGNTCGISTIMADENMVAYNVISSNVYHGETHGMCFGGGQLNQFHHNNFAYNNGDTLQAYDIGGGIDYWYSIPDSEGNWWSDYTGPDNNGDGIGDIPYDIDGFESQDLAPLMSQLFSVTAGGVSNGSGPIEGVLVQVQGTVILDYTDINGMYSLEPLGAGMYDISFSHALYRDTVVVGVPAALDCTTALDVVMGPLTGIDENNQSAPRRFALFQNYPNPFNAKTSIRFILENAQDVDLTVYDLLGRKIDTIVDGKLQAGVHKVIFDASSLSGGVYFYKLQAGDEVETKRMVLLK